MLRDRFGLGEGGAKYLRGGGLEYEKSCLARTMDPTGPPGGSLYAPPCPSSPQWVNNSTCLGIFRVMGPFWTLGGWDKAP